MNVRDKMLNGDYDLKLGVPENPKYLCPNSDCEKLHQVPHKYCDQCGEHLEDHFLDILSDYKIEMYNYRTERYNKFTAFTTDFLDENRIFSFPGRENIFSSIQALCNVGR